MSNRFRQSLYKDITNKKQRLKEKEELDHNDLLKNERLDELENELNRLPNLTEDEYNRLKRKIREVEI